MFKYMCGNENIELGRIHNKNKRNADLLEKSPKEAPPMHLLIWI